MGKPRDLVIHLFAIAVHPHPRGEALVCLIPDNHAAGSPPPAWGSPHSGTFGCLAFRFTPTRVGKPVADVLRPHQLAVHPHPRGEASSRRHTRFTTYGSPPPAWGSPAIWNINVYRTRFTPTRVGKPGPRSAPITAPSVHPHPRGEAVTRSAVDPKRNGSPPPAWGSLELLHPVDVD